MYSETIFKSVSQKEQVKKMTVEEIKNGESKNIEFKIQLPDESKKYMKTIVAYANTSGGKIIIGVDDVARKIIGVR